MDAAFSSGTSCVCSPPGAAPTPSRSATGAGCPSSSWPRRAATGTPGPRCTAFEHQLVIPQWDLCLRVMIYRKHVQHESPKNSSSICLRRTTGTSSTTRSPPTWPLRCRPSTRSSAAGGRREDDRRTQRRVRPRCRPDPPLRRQLCLATTDILAHNVAVSFQLDTIATPRRRSRKRTYAYVVRSMRTLRFCSSGARVGWAASAGGTSPPLSESGDRGPLLSSPHALAA